MFICLIVGAFANDPSQYNFQYSTNDEGGHQREESGHGKVVKGRYSYVDPNGNVRSVRYVADEYGYHPEGDITVDQETARQGIKQYL